MHLYQPCFYGFAMQHTQFCWSAKAPLQYWIHQVKRLNSDLIHQISSIAMPAWEYPSCIYLDYCLSNQFPSWWRTLLQRILFQQFLVSYHIGDCEDSMNQLMVQKCSSRLQRIAWRHLEVVFAYLVYGKLEIWQHQAEGWTCLRAFQERIGADECSLKQRPEAHAWCSLEHRPLRARRQGYVWLLSCLS